MISALRLRIVEAWAKPLQFQDKAIISLEGAWASQPLQVVQRV
jgi:hypothetical protein